MTRTDDVMQPSGLPSDRVHMLREVNRQLSELRTVLLLAHQLDRVGLAWDQLSPVITPTLPLLVQVLGTVQVSPAQISVQHAPRWTPPSGATGDRWHQFRDTLELAAGLLPREVFELIDGEVVVPAQPTPSQTTAVLGWSTQGGASFGAISLAQMLLMRALELGHITVDLVPTTPAGVA
ncbi:hypothetical protein QOL99_06035 [Deinococcus sp. MIMF12]|uniref:Uncharacterized protein n=1 Tax=Deinococcus rhizophilus TaxID=3049544 RepID=A0ABT7JF70_9DEIO|nr:hypothetical protein [Deinococcus rhizophilus]MDL2343709.1 hypothetical protein [Deinococcus rhizophilus]